MKKNEPTQQSERRQILAEASDLIDGERNFEYGPPTGDFVAISDMWTAYIRRVFAGHKGDLADFAFRPHDVAVFIALMKISRIGWSPTKRDHWVDLAGYAGCGWECVADEIECGEL